MSHQPFSRRTLFHTAAAASAAGLALAAGGRRASAGPKPLPLKIGLASYSMRKHSIDKLVDLCKEADIKHVTLKDMHLPRNASPPELQSIREKFEAAGVSVMGGGVINMPKNDEAAIRKEFEYARAAKLPLIVASPAPETLDTVEKLIKEFGIPLAIHNHGPEDKHYPSPKEVMAAIKKRDKRLGACMDIGHTVRAGVEPVDCVALCGDRLLDLHIKDLRDKTNKDSQVEVGRGAIDVVGLVKALLKRRFQGHVALEYEINADSPMAGIRESLAYLRGITAALAG